MGTVIDLKSARARKKLLSTKPDPFLDRIDRIRNSIVKINSLFDELRRLSEEHNVNDGKN